MSTYEKPDEETAAAVREVLATPAHMRLGEAGVTVYVLAVFGPIDKDGELKGPALKHHGCPALAIVKITSPKHRAAGLADFELLIDGDQWMGFDDDERRFIIDHELTHIEVVEPQDGELRPRLQMRPHDHQFGWFNEVAARGGMKSQECQQARRLVDEDGQLYFDLDSIGVVPTSHPGTGTRKKLDS